jgi:hypothetical protein
MIVFFTIEKGNHMSINEPTVNGKSNHAYYSYSEKCININLDEKFEEIIISSMAGKQIKVKQANNNNQFKVELQPGIYLISAIHKDNRIYTEKVVVFAL